jgi:NAD(P)-dependent dehydrogenase (short-subunit alcohol dehydrogenase family)
MKIAVIDGKGGGIGRQIVERLKSLKSSDLEIIALGTNSQATANMIKAGADDGATGENAVVWMSSKVDIIVGPMAIIVANAMMGEVSPKMAEAVANSSAMKFLLPINKCNINIVGVEDKKLNSLFDELYNSIKTKLNEE